MKWAMEEAPILLTMVGRNNSTAAHVLQALAYHANAEWLAWPSLERLSLETGLGASTIREALCALEGAGLVSREQDGADAGWHLHEECCREVPIQMGVQEAIASRREGARVRQGRRRQSVTVTPATGVTVTLESGVTQSPVTPEPGVMSRQTLPTVTPVAGVTYIRNELKEELPLELAAPPKRRKSAPSTDETIKAFDDFWATYPRRGGKPMNKDDARRAWAAVVKAGRKPDADGKTWTVEQITDGARRYAQECEGLLDRHFVKTPGPWLRAGGWKYDDGPGPAGRDPREFVNDCWRRGSVTEIRKIYDSDYFQPPAGEGDYVEDVLRPYNKRWITEHKDQILARLTTQRTSTSEAS
jgi:hypothetical protein